MPTRSVGTRVKSVFYRDGADDAECDEVGPETDIADIAEPLCDAERHELHANAERWHESQKRFSIAIALTTQSAT